MITVKIVNDCKPDGALDSPARMRLSAEKVFCALDDNEFWNFSCATRAIENLAKQEYGRKFISINGWKLYTGKDVVDDWDKSDYYIVSAWISYKNFEAKNVAIPELRESTIIELKEPAPRKPRPALFGSNND